jgi:hypothetical protein
MSRFESLPNETIIEIFEFLDGAHLHRAFHNLNTRFNSLLFDSVPNYRFNLRCINKREFDMLCSQTFMIVIDRIVSLSFLENDESPNMLAYFFAHGSYS